MLRCGVVGGGAASVIAPPLACRVCGTRVTAQACVTRTLPGTTRYVCRSRQRARACVCVSVCLCLCLSVWLCVCLSVSVSVRAACVPLGLTATRRTAVTVITTVCPHPTRHTSAHACTCTLMGKRYCNSTNCQSCVPHTCLAPPLTPCHVVCASAAAPPPGRPTDGSRRCQATPRHRRRLEGAGAPSCASAWAPPEAPPFLSSFAPNGYAQPEDTRA